jgi:hypothetical protein
MAGDKSLNWRPLGTEFILLGQKLEKIGFIYDKGRVIVSEDPRD